MRILSDETQKGGEVIDETVLAKPAGAAAGEICGRKEDCPTPLLRREPAHENGAKTRLDKDLMENMVKIRAFTQNTTDLLERQIEVSGVKVAILMCEGMINLQLFTQIMVRPLSSLEIQDADGEAVAHWVSKQTVLSGDQKEFFTYDELFTFLMAGFVVLLIDGVDRGIACGMQGFSFRSVSEPSTEMNISGSREGFVEPIRINQTMIRRRIRSPSLKFEIFPVGEKSRTDICLVYLTDTVDQRLVESVRKALRSVSSGIVLSQGYLRPYLEGKPLSPFSSVGTTERPDTLCAKINEGRIGILVDGTPFALIVPYLFSENFQSMDDYTYRPYYGSFIRLLKYLAFLSPSFCRGCMWPSRCSARRCCPTPCCLTSPPPSSRRRFR